MRTLQEYPWIHGLGQKPSAGAHALHTEDPEGSAWSLLPSAKHRELIRPPWPQSCAVPKQEMEPTARQGKHSCAHGSSRSPPSPAPPRGHTKPRSFQPGMSHFPRHPCCLWNGTTQLCTGCLPAVQLQRFLINTPESGNTTQEDLRTGPFAFP